ncbi:UxaA family hydrolase [Sedimentitalea nanhaiensis]|uniref:SAF domain-containing protein n=1 Tax=Sedimentitalea nanhaiensis TaxID=999627 RepID=A0A1I7E345_9RHOB|nr:UxaA family hydrolase [Sedimentitalea nanhaiensis]SFU18253.1 SAF domain-containing protein [Sedimentitalea nanhaiensis]
MPAIDPRLIVLNTEDTVAVARCAIAAGEVLQIGTETITLGQAVTMGHKLARAPMQAGDKVLKYGVPIGSATQAIAVGEHVHLHNIKSDYTPTYALTDTGEIA